MDDFARWKASELKTFLKGTVWRVGTNEKGVDYYYDKVKKKSQWVKPEDITEFESTLTYELFLIHQEAIGHEVAEFVEDIKDAELITDAKVSSKGPQKKGQLPIAEQNEPVVEKTYTKGELISILDGKDSILEPGIVTHARQLIHEHKEPVPEVVDKLVKNYCGYPMMATVLMEWIKFAKVLEIWQNNRDTLSESGSSTSSGFANTTAAASIAHFSSAAHNGEIVAPLLADLISQRFNRKLADSLLTPNTDLNRADKSVPVVPAFVHDMVQNPTFNATLHELKKEHKNSTFLQACCSGAYTVALSDREDESIRYHQNPVAEQPGTSSSTVPQLRGEDLVLGDVRRMHDVAKQLALFVELVGEEIGECRNRILRLVGSATEAVKLVTLHCIAQQLKPITSVVSTSTAAGVNGANNGAALPVSVDCTSTSMVGSSSFLSKKRSLDEMSSATGAAGAENANSSDEHAMKAARGCEAEATAPPSASYGTSAAAAATTTDRYEEVCVGALQAATTVLSAAQALTELQHAVTLAASIQSAASEYNDSDVVEEQEVHSNPLPPSARQFLRSVIQDVGIFGVQVGELFELHFDSMGGREVLRGDNPFDASYLQHPVVQQLLSDHALGHPKEPSASQALQLLALGGSLSSAPGRRLLSPAVQHKECANRLFEAVQLCPLIAESFFGAIPSAHCDSLRTLMKACAASAMYVVRWCRRSAMDEAHLATSLSFLPVLKLLVSFVRVAVEAHPLCYSHCATTCEAIFDGSKTVLRNATFRSDQAAQESVMTLAATEVQKEVLEVLTTLVSLGCVYPPMQFFICNIASQNSSCDTDTIRHLLHCMLACDNISALVGAEEYAKLFVELFHSDSAQKAIKSQHFAAADRALLVTVLNGNSSANRDCASNSNISSTSNKIIINRASCSSGSVGGMQLDKLPILTQQRRADLLQLCNTLASSS